MLPRLKLTRLAAAICLIATPACAQETAETAAESEKKAVVEKKVDNKDPNSKPNIPKNAAVDAVVWGAVIYAKEAGKAHKMPKELPDLEKRLTKIKGFETYKNFEVIGQHTQKVFSEYTNWLVPSKELFLNIDSKGPAAEGGMNLHVQLWRRSKVLVKTDTTLKKGSPLVIGGPKWRDGQLIFVLLLKE